MIESAKQLRKYKTILAKLNKTFPKGRTNQGFTIDISYGGNREPDIKRLGLGGVASDPSLGNEFLEIVFQSTKDNIEFWQKMVLHDIRTLEDSLKD